MRPTYQLLQHACQITLFTRTNCSLCSNAKKTLSQIWDVRPFVYREIDVMASEGKVWRDLYEFDTPVIHVSSSKRGDELPELASKAHKLMHRFTDDEVKAKMDAAEAESN